MSQGLSLRYSLGKGLFPYNVTVLRFLHDCGNARSAQLVAEQEAALSHV
jgi:hypothetical protein